MKCSTEGNENCEDEHFELYYKYNFHGYINCYISYPLLTELERSDVDCINSIRVVHLDHQRLIAMVTAVPPPGVVAIAVKTHVSSSASYCVVENVHQLLDIYPENEVYDWWTYEQFVSS